ncbi:hypothetical protein HMPREF1404_01300 [Helicobacter pylori GAM210Bi]|nr:hypothetical protein HMPREF1404_01300 [Helicobacter pylori GAM210Bi]
MHSIFLLCHKIEHHSLGSPPKYYFFNYFIIANCNLKSQTKTTPKIPIIVGYLTIKPFYSRLKTL